MTDPDPLFEEITAPRDIGLQEERDRYRKTLERIGRVHGEWRAVVADALRCSVDDLDPRKNRGDDR